MAAPPSAPWQRKGAGGRASTRIYTGPDSRLKLGQELTRGARVMARANRGASKAW
jgi:hypothetical protein